MTLRSSINMHEEMKTLPFTQSHIFNLFVYKLHYSVICIFHDDLKDDVKEDVKEEYE